MHFINIYSLLSSLFLSYYSIYYIDIFLENGDNFVNKLEIRPNFTNMDVWLKEVFMYENYISIS